jgi:hypothetical protein
MRYDNEAHEIKGAPKSQRIDDDAVSTALHSGEKNAAAIHSLPDYY